VDTIYFDFAKAFDTVPNKRLLAKVHSYGIIGDILSGIKSFLNGRAQRVVVNGQKSSWTDVILEVPQGSILDPILFIIYTNDIPQSVDSVCQLFADDTNCRVISGTEDQEALQCDINNLCTWSDKWSLRFNTKKCKMIHYGDKSVDTNYTIKNIDGTNTELETANTEKYLSIHFTSSLKFDEHINKANSITRLIEKFQLHGQK